MATDTMLSQCVTFLYIEGRYPYAGAHNLEGRLGTWLDAHRYEPGVAEWRNVQLQAFSERWLRFLDVWCHGKGRFPMYCGHSAGERELAAWAGRQVDARVTFLRDITPIKHGVP